MTEVWPWQACEGRGLSHRSRLTGAVRTGAISLLYLGFVVFFMRQMTRICFVRHGETDWNIELRMQGHVDIPLNAKGLAQAAAVGRYFSGRAVDALYSSDLLRARQTAQPIAEALQLPMALRRELRERNFGRCEGLTLAELETRFAEEALAMRRRDPDHVPLEGESRRQHQARILACVTALHLKHRGQSIVVVTHGGVLDVVYRQVHGLPPETPRTYPIPNAGINWVAVGDAGWRIESWGETVTHP